MKIMDGLQGKDWRRPRPELAEMLWKECPLSRCHVSLPVMGLLAAPLVALSVPAVAAVPQYAAPGRTAGAGFCRIAGSSATVRAEPRTNATALGTASMGEACVAYGWVHGDGVWVKVTLDRTGVTGYVLSSLVAWGKEDLTATGR
ncbi:MULTISPECIES: SH3 domain-containing protein [unclassified Streptomyces]|uniref:SH3 domain-containing protein n=1 Tax=unclassified Streptomyces TaxID=2593676 RepID=UPI0037F2CC57